MDKLSQAGIDFIKSWEGCVLHPYKDAGGTITIGYGFTYYPTSGVKVELTDNPITQAQADAMFLITVEPFVQGVCDAVGASRTLGSNELTSLTSFAYNLGLGAFKTSTLLEHVLHGGVVESDFVEYDHIKGVVDNDLLKRRIAEYNLFVLPETTGTSVETIISKTTSTMDNTTAVERVIKVKSVSIVYDEYENGTLTNGDVAAIVNAPDFSPEFLSALQAQFTDSNFNGTYEQ